MGKVYTLDCQGQCLADATAQPKKDSDEQSIPDTNGLLLYTPYLAWL
jgi:hypothetical protein